MARALAGGCALCSRHLVVQPMQDEWSGRNRACVSAAWMRTTTSSRPQPSTSARPQWCVQVTRGKDAVVVATTPKWRCWIEMTTRRRAPAQHDCLRVPLGAARCCCGETVPLRATRCPCSHRVSLRTAGCCVSHATLAQKGTSGVCLFRFPIRFIYTLIETSATGSPRYYLVTVIYNLQY